jgi:hypothetical protein
VREREGGRTLSDIRLRSSPVVSILHPNQPISPHRGRRPRRHRRRFVRSSGSSRMGYSMYSYSIPTKLSLTPHPPRTDRSTDRPTD